MAKQEMMRILSPLGDESASEPPRNVYLWGYQPHFAISAKVAAEALFGRLDEAILPDTFVVAIRDGEDSRCPAAVVEPEDHEFKPDDFSNVLKLTAELGKIEPGPNYAYPVGSKHGEVWAEEEKRRGFVSRVRKAIKQTVAGACRFNPRKVYVSPGRELGPYLVYTVLLLDEAVCNSHPVLRRTTRGGYSVVTSLIDAVAYKFVDSCWQAIVLSFAGQGTDVFPPTESLLRSGAASFMYTPFGACDEFVGLHGGFEACTEISTLTYEKTTRRSRLILARAGHESITESLSFPNAPSLRNYRAVRKLLQLAEPGEGLICDSAHILGVGALRKNYDASNEDLFCVEFVGHAKWELTHAGVALMRVEHGVPQLPKKLAQVKRFCEGFARLFPNAGNKQMGCMNRVASAATELTHGTIIIVAEDAATEAARFGNQCTIVDPQPLTDNLLEKASRIDGAILVSPDGACYAIGVILDGQVSDKGTSDRGARYNSTVRYVLGSRTARIGLVVSDDGMVDIVPEWRPRISRQEIGRRLESLRTVVGDQTVNQREMNKLTKWIKDQGFYLSSEQCDEVNGLIAEAERKSDRSAAWIVYQQFVPHPDMNDTYLDP